MSTYIVGSFNQLNNILGIWWQNSNFWFWNHLWEFLGKTWNVKSVKSPTIFAPQADRKWKVHLIYLVHRLNILCHCKNRLNPVFFQLHSKLSNRGVVLEIFGEWRRDGKENKVICMCVWGVSVYINASMDFISLFSVQSDFFCPYSKQLKERGKHWMLINLIQVLLRSWTKHMIPYIPSQCSWHKDCFPCNTFHHWVPVYRPAFRPQPYGIQHQW